MAKTTTKRKRRKTSVKKPAPDNASRLAYDAAETSTQRKAPSSTIKSVDNLLTPQKRKRLQSKARDLQENFSIAAWAIRRHLDYVTPFSFMAQTGDPGLDAEIENLIDWYARPRNCDLAGRHSLGQLVRMGEASRTVDGDVFFLKMRSGHLQAIESDRIRDPEQITTGNGAPRGSWIHGVRVGGGGRALSYAVHKRTDRGAYEFEKTVSAGNIYHLGYFDRFDQIRGVSPLASAIHTFRDCYESWEYALGKAKVAQLFGLVFYREAAEPVALPTATDSDGAPTDPAGTGYDVSFNQGPVKLDLDPGDRAEFIESKSPAPEFQSFTNTMIGAALKALDLPFSFYDESFTNFFGSRAALLHYERSAKNKRQQLQELLNKIVGWRLRQFIADGVLTLPSSAQLRFDWIPAGIPWWDPTKEIKGDVMAINAGLTTRSQVIKERHGREFRDIIDQLAAEKEYIQAAGLVLSETSIEDEPAGASGDDE